MGWPPRGEPKIIGDLQNDIRFPRLRRNGNRSKQRGGKKVSATEHGPISSHGFHAHYLRITLPSAPLFRGAPVRKGSPADAIEWGLK